MNEDLVCKALQGMTGLKWVSEHRFHEKRKWRFDFAQIELMMP